MSPGCGPQFSPAAATLLNTRTTAEVFARVALTPALPAKLRQRMAPSAWARAALLDQAEVANQVASAAGESEPAIKGYIQQYLQAKTHEERQFAAVFAILHFPGLRPYVDGPYPRLTAFQVIDNTRDNWWCGDVGGDVMEVNFAKQWRDNAKMPYSFSPLGTGTEFHAGEHGRGTGGAKDPHWSDIPLSSIQRAKSAPPTNGASFSRWDRLRATCLGSSSTGERNTPTTRGFPKRCTWQFEPCAMAARTH